VRLPARGEQQLNVLQLRRADLLAEVQAIRLALLRDDDQSALPANPDAGRRVRLRGDGGREPEQCERGDERSHVNVRV
jgi:hypothetical protein